MRPGGWDGGSASRTSAVGVASIGGGVGVGASASASISSPRSAAPSIDVAQVFVIFLNYFSRFRHREAIQWFLFFFFFTAANPKWRNLANSR